MGIVRVAIRALAVRLAEVGRCAMADTVFEADLQVPANTPVGSVYFTHAR